jgi:rubredoxin
MTAGHRSPLLWRCPGCGCPSWPGCDPQGRPVPRRCVPCQIAYDDQQPDPEQDGGAAPR